MERPPETQALEAEPTSGEEDDLLLTDNHIEAGDLFLLQQAPSHLGLPAPAASGADFSAVPASGLDFSAVRPVSGLDSSSAPSDFSAAVAGLTSVVSTSRPGPSSSSGFKRVFFMFCYKESFEIFYQFGCAEDFSFVINMHTKKNIF